MGVPKFFRYISERYPCLTELIKEYQIPEFDNLYLDMNGIIHMCSHPDDNDPHFRITEEKIFADIFHYIEVLFHMIKPQKLFFMAVDGVAPRAKMNQQRGRRFRTAKEAEKMEQKAQEKGEAMPEQARFDSNCITPGTLFMAKLQEQLKYFIVNKISMDPLWQKCKIILSGHETPGEGEHKVMDYIRYLRAQPGHDPNTRHCLYGLDADLIMLGLCTHEPHFSLLREEVKFGKKNNQKRKNVPEQITFYLLHLSLMREYLEQEFIAVKDNLSFGYDIESIIDDWVLMGFLVGNDFIPHLPNLHIANGALPLLYNAYMKVLPTFGGYINENGKLNLERFEKFMATLCSIDMEQFSEQYADLKYFESKTGRRPNEKERTSYKPRKLEEWQGEDADEGLFGALEGEEVKPMNSDLAALIKATDTFVGTSDENLAEETEENNSEVVESESESLSEDDLLDAEFKLHKKDYYMNKLQYEQVTPEVMRAQAEGYVRAIQWNLNYYYSGVCSWSWYYEHHYAPFISDIKDFKDFKIEFDLGKPFHPYEQLLGVLPTASKKLLPECYHPLMEDSNSQIFDYYPTNFNTDLNGKKQDWEAVVLIPFIDEKRLLAAMATCNDKLTPEEVKRNTHGPMLVYEYTTDDLAEYEAPEYFPPVTNNHALCTKITNEEIRVPEEKLVKSAYPGALFDVYYPGFPTTKHLKYKSYLEKGGVKVFDQPSRGETLYLEILPKPLPAPEAIAEELLGNVVFVSWPHLVEAMVVSVSTSEYRYHYANIPGEYKVESNKGNVGHNWKIEKDGIIEYYRDKRGVIVGETDILVHCRLMTGRKYVFTSQGRINLEKQWSDTTNAYPYQVIVKNITQHNPEYKPYQNIEDVFTANSTCFMLGLPHYGYQGTVQDSSESLKKGRVKLTFTVADEPDLRHLYRMEQKLSTSYMPVHIAASLANVSKRLFSRITGTILIFTGGVRSMGLHDDAPKHNVGLNLKFNKRNEEIPGYTKKDGAWLYSQKAIDLLNSYQEKYPKLFHFLETSKNCDVYYEYEIFPEDNGSGETVKEIVNWLRSQEYYSIEKQQCGSNTLEPDIVKQLENIIDEHEKKSEAPKTVVMQVKPFLLYKPGLLMGNLSPDPKATFRLYDRVVCIRESYTVPLGHVGTIIAIHKSVTGKPEDFLYDVLFDKPFPGGLSLNCSALRGYKMSRLSLINRTHGVREMEMKTGKPGQLYQKIGYNPSPFGGSMQKFTNPNQNSAFAAWNNRSPQHEKSFQNYAGNNASQGPSQQEMNNSNGRNVGVRKNAKKAKVSSQQIDFMPFKKSTTTNGQHEQQEKNVDTPPKQPKQQEQVKIKKSPEKQDSVQPNLGVSLTANDLFAHVSAQMQKMNITAPQTAAMDFPVSSQPTPFAPPIPQSLPFPAAPAQGPPVKGFGIKLLTECQRRGLRCPLYQYFHDKTTQQYQVQLKLSFLNEPIFGQPALTKLEATENVAEIGLQKLAAHNQPIAFPAPPMQWCMPRPSQQQQSPPKHQPPPPQGAFGHPRMPQPQVPQQYVTQQQFQQLQQQLQQPQQQNVQQQPGPMHAAQPRHKQAAQPAPRIPGLSATRPSVPFVPLQAVKQQRIHRNSNSSQQSAKKNSHGRKSDENRSGAQQGQVAGQEKSSRNSKHESDARDSKEKEGNAGKPRRERKIRIAANFSVPP